MARRDEHSCALSDLVEPNPAVLIPLRLKYRDLRIDRLGLGENVGLVLGFYGCPEINLGHFLRV